MKIIKCDICKQIIKGNYTEINIPGIIRVEDCCKSCTIKIKEYIQEQQKHYEL